VATHAHEPTHAHLAGHSHGRDASRRALTLTLALTGAFTIAEVIAGLLTDSLALIADAAHMLSDDLSLGLALFAIWLASRPSSPRRTFGFQRAEILAALFNGVTLVAISAWIFYEAYNRFDDPPDVLGGPMLVVAVLGLAINAGAAAILYRGGDDSLNVSAALRHVLADLLGSVGVVVAAIVILTTGWEYADPLVSVVIGVVVLGSSWSVIRDSVVILLEASPRGLDVAAVGEAMAATPGVVQVHDLHVWTITSGFPALAAHVVVEAEADCHAKRRELERLLHDRFKLAHTTLQVDHDRPDLLQIENAPRGETADGPAQ
jgi:cobalt-zinc-cadmium efflux system protein